MNKKKTSICEFKNERVNFKSLTGEFTPKLYEQFDLKAKNLLKKK